MILALKTAGTSTEVRLFGPPTSTAPAAALDWESGRELSDQLLARLTDFIHDHHHTLTDLTGIVIFSGPGSFTSLRIGHTVANALADSLGIPVVGVMGDDWLEQGRSLAANTQLGVPALPHYGAEAHITKPKPAGHTPPTTHQ
jgi:tRNA threonylcarbamoyladenosine biosynthesis protein TsaB